MMRFRFSWKITLFSAFFLVLFVNLGFWQLQREVEKRNLLETREDLRGSEPKTSQALSGLPFIEGVPVRLEGQFDPDRVLLLDNKVLDGQVGFEVLQIFHDQEGDFLVNRGFLAMGRTRQDLPAIPPVPGRVKILGWLHEPADNLILSERTPAGEYPVIVQKIDFGWLESRGLQLFPGVVRLGEQETGALPRYWPDVVMLPEQHRGYAIQWFAMALAITLAWLYFSFTQEVTDDKP